MKNYQIIIAPIYSEMSIAFTYPYSYTLNVTEQLQIKCYDDMVFYINFATAEESQALYQKLSATLNLY